MLKYHHLWILVILTSLAFVFSLNGTLHAQTNPFTKGVASEQSNGDSGSPSISADGRFVAFESRASNLVPGDITCGSAFTCDDVLVNDRLTDTTELISITLDGKPANNYSGGPSISADGRYVAFGSSSSDLVPNDTNGVFDIFVYDRQTGQMSRVSQSSTGEQGDSQSYSPDISADGRFVAFVSDAGNFAPNDSSANCILPSVPSNCADVFVRDRQTSTTERISVSNSGDPIIGSIGAPSISADGRFVVFSSDATNLVPGDTNNPPCGGVAPAYACKDQDIFLVDRQTSTLSRINLTDIGGEANSNSAFPHISADGQFISFYSGATNLISGDQEGGIFVVERQTGTIMRVTTSGFNPVISNDGHFVAFVSNATNLVTEDTNGVQDVFVRDMQSGQIMRVSISSDGTQADGTSDLPAISADGNVIVFQSKAGNLVPDDVNQNCGAACFFNLFIHQMDTGKTSFLDVSGAG